MTKLLSCRYNMDTNRVEARFEDGTTVAIDCIERLPQRGKLSPKATDEGQPFPGHPLTGCSGKLTPHPASVRASATFPHRGRHFPIHTIYSQGRLFYYGKKLFCQLRRCRRGYYRRVPLC